MREAAELGGVSQGCARGEADVPLPFPSPTFSSPFHKRKSGRADTQAQTAPHNVAPISHRIGCSTLMSTDVCCSRLPSHRCTFLFPWRARPRLSSFPSLYVVLFSRFVPLLCALFLSVVCVRVVFWVVVSLFCLCLRRLLLCVFPFAFFVLCIFASPPTRRLNMYPYPSLLTCNLHSQTCKLKQRIEQQSSKQPIAPSALKGWRARMWHGL